MTRILEPGLVWPSILYTTEPSCYFILSIENMKAAYFHIYIKWCRDEIGLLTWTKARCFFIIICV